MSDTLAEATKSASKVSANDGLPKPDIHLSRRLEELNKSELKQQAAQCLHEIRLQQARDLGFVQMDIPEAVELLMGSPHNEVDKQDDNKQHYEWFWNHQTGKVSTNWHQSFTVYKRYEKRQTIWECGVGCLDYLKAKIPYGVVLRINELKELKVFNGFEIIAPVDLWHGEEEDLDPIVMGMVTEVPPTIKKGSVSYHNGGEEMTFVIAQW